MELVTMLLSALISGAYGQWSSTSLGNACESYIHPYPCPDLPCYACESCLTNYVFECECIPQVFLEAHSEPDGFLVCNWIFIYWGFEPKCCDYYKDLKRNSISQEEGESVNPFSGPLPDMSDTHKRDNGKPGNNTTNSENEDAPISVAVQDNLTNSTTTQYKTNETGVNETQADADEEDLKNIDITENTADNKESDNEAAPQDENRTGSDTKTTNSDNDKDSSGDETTDSHNKGRKRRDSILMRALLLAQDILTDMHHKNNIP